MPEKSNPETPERPQMPQELKDMLTAMPLSIEELELDIYWEKVSEFVKEQSRPTPYLLMFNPNIRPLVFPLRHPTDLARSCENLAEFLGSEECIQMIQKLPVAQKTEDQLTKRLGLVHYLSSVIRAGYSTEEVLQIAKKIHMGQSFPLDEELEGLNMAMRGMSTRYADMDADKGCFNELKAHAAKMGQDKAHEIYRAAILSTRMSPIGMYMYRASLEKNRNFEAKEAECRAIKMTDSELLAEAYVRKNTAEEEIYKNEFIKRHPEEEEQMNAWLNKPKTSTEFKTKYIGEDRKIHKSIVADRLMRKESLKAGEMKAPGTRYLRASKTRGRGKNAQVEKIWNEKTSLYHLPYSLRFDEGILAIKISTDTAFRKNVVNKIMQGSKGQIPWLRISNLSVAPELFNLFAEEILNDPELTQEMCRYWRDSTHFILNGANLICIARICKTHPERFEEIIQKMTEGDEELEGTLNQDSFVFFLHQFSEEDQIKIFTIYLETHHKKEEGKTAKQLKKTVKILGRVNTERLEAACNVFFKGEERKEIKPVTVETVKAFANLPIPDDFKVKSSLEEIEREKSLLATGRRSIHISGVNISIEPLFSADRPAAWKTIVERNGEEFEINAVYKGNGGIEINLSVTPPPNVLKKISGKLFNQVIYYAHLLYVREEKMEEGFVKDVKSRTAATKARTRLTKGITKRTSDTTLTARGESKLNAYKTQLREVMASSRDQIGKLLEGAEVEQEKLYVFKLMNPENPAEGYQRVDTEEVQKRRNEGSLLDASPEKPQLFILSTEPHARKVGVYKKEYPLGDSKFVILYGGERSKDAEKKHRRHEQSGLPIMGHETLESLTGTIAVVRSTTTQAVRDENGKVIGIRNPDEITRLADTFKNKENYSKAWGETKAAQLNSDIMDRLEAGWPIQNTKLRKMMAEAIAWENSTEEEQIDFETLSKIIPLLGEERAHDVYHAQKGLPLQVKYQIAQTELTKKESGNEAEDLYDSLKLSVLHDLLFKGESHPDVEAFELAKQRTHIEFRNDRATIELGVEVPFRIDVTYVEGVFTPLSEVQLEKKSTED